jgi:hypothetical protein
MMSQSTSKPIPTHQAYDSINTNHFEAFLLVCGHRRYRILSRQSRPSKPLSSMSVRPIKYDNVHPIDHPGTVQQVTSPSNADVCIQLAAAAIVSILLPTVSLHWTSIHPVFKSLLSFRLQHQINPKVSTSTSKGAAGSAEGHPPMYLRRSKPRGVRNGIACASLVPD